MNLTLICILFIITIFQTAVIPHLAVLGVTPDLFLIFTVFYSLNVEVKRGAIVNWVCGILKDIFSLGIFGISSFLLVLMGYIIGSAREFVFKEHPLTQVLITLLSSIFYGLCYLLFFLIFFEDVKLTGMVQKTVFSALYSAAISPLLFLIFNIFRSKLKISRSLTFEKKHY